MTPDLGPQPAIPAGPAGTAPGDRRMDLATAVSRPFRLLAALALALLALVGVSTGTDLLVLSPQQSQAWRTAAVLRDSQQGMLDQETGVRGFLLAPVPRDEQFLEPYRRGRAAHELASEELLRLDVPPQIARALRDRERAADRWDAEWARTGASDDTGRVLGRNVTQTFLERGTRLFDDYRRADATARRLLDARQDRLELLRGVVSVAESSLGTLLVLGTLLAVRRTRRRLLVSVAGPLEQVATAVRAGADGDLARHVPSGGVAELDDLAGDVRALFASLSARDAQSRAHAEELDVLGAASRALLTDPDPRTAICRAAARLTGAPQAFLLEPDGAGSLVDTASIGSPVGQLVLPLTGEANLAAEVYTSRRSVLVDDVHSDPRVARRVVSGLPPTGGAWLPVLSDDRCVGVLVVAMPRRLSELPSSLPASLEVLAGAAAVAIDRTDLHHQLARQARTDALTGVANRRTWDEQLSVELARSTRTARPLSVAMLDLDRFKAYNDSRGHQAGDELLSAAAAAWAARLRTTDLLARYGGEEFAVALPDCDLAAAVDLLDALRGLVPDGQTCSVGVTTWDGEESAQQVLARADAALYTAKHGGRDRVVAAPAPATVLDAAAALAAH